MPRQGETWYSDYHRGASGNFHKKVRFDVTDKYIGITQIDREDGTVERVLLSPAQAKELAEWIKAYCL